MLRKAKQFYVLMIIFILISLAYLILISLLIYGWKKVPEFELNFSSAETKFSIVVPFRNEANNLPELLDSFSRLDYPPSHFEILLVNDASEDDSVKVCIEFADNHPELNIAILESLRTYNSPKKDAIISAVKKAKFEYIITTDADCEVPKYWLQAYNDITMESPAKLVAGPVAINSQLNTALAPRFTQNKGRKTPYFQIFEELDVLSLQAAGMGAFGIHQPFMCNGANLCYEKSAFLEINVYSGNHKIASGDDVFLLQKFRQKKLKSIFLKSREALVITRPQESLAKLISQRIRWAAKTSAYDSVFAKITGAIVLLMNMSLATGIILVLSRVVTYHTFLILFLLKFNVDFILLYQSAIFFERKALLRSYLWSSLVYPFFSTFVAIKSLFSGFEWKGRKFSK